MTGEMTGEGTTAIDGTTTESATAIAEGSSHLPHGRKKSFNVMVTVCETGMQGLVIAHTTATAVTMSDAKLPTRVRVARMPVSSL